MLKAAKTDHLMVCVVFLITIISRPRASTYMPLFHSLFGLNPLDLLSLSPWVSPLCSHNRAHGTPQHAFWSPLLEQMVIFTSVTPLLLQLPPSWDDVKFRKWCNVYVKLATPGLETDLVEGT